jgi:RHS repeat-associated protein
MPLIAIRHKQGVILAHYDYYAYGLMWSDPEAGNIHDQTYQSREWNQNEFGDTGMDLYRFEARMYDPVIGRWTSLDPSLQFFNNYIAMANNPANFVDPDGRFAILNNGHPGAVPCPWGTVVSDAGASIVGVLATTYLFLNNISKLKGGAISAGAATMLNHATSVLNAIAGGAAGRAVGDGLSKQVDSPNNAEEDDWGVYAEGQHNVVYILVTEEGKKELQKQGTSGQAIADQINANMKSLGLYTEAVYWTGDPRYFDGNKLSSTASVAVIGGNRDDVSKFYREELDSWFADKSLDNPNDRWAGGVNNPERSENFEHSDHAGKAKYIAVDGSALTGFGQRISSEKEKINATKTGALIVMHGMGHNADMDCGTSSFITPNNSSIMSSMDGMKRFVEKFGYKKFFQPKESDDHYVDKLKARYYKK